MRPTWVHFHGPPFTVFEFAGVGGQSGLSHNHLAHCFLGTDRLQHLYGTVLEQRAVAVSESQICSTQCIAFPNSPSAVGLVRI